MWTFFRHYRHSFSKGFTLIELLVVVAVISIITAFLLFSQGKFNSATLLRSLGYSVALTVRQAQVYGVTVRGISVAGSPSFSRGYGAYISTGDLARMDIFSDLNGNGQLDTSPTDERLVPTGSLIFSKGYALAKFCAVQNNGQQDCYPSGIGGGATATSMTIYFTRPNLDACIASSVQPGVCAPGGSSPYTSAYIQIYSTNNADLRTVRITSTGQIVVCQLNANPLTC
ncbi:MAG: type II secretion system protein [Patescibacteria group bacterium]